ncbi:peptidoglycan D,D-transpeptidase FtsI family protein [Alteribacter populi]|uniref:peptidoglycan D,D-transpeptidase FtsI family protein n=1 Tax=Alteribacter populi TaxID=2011011 RepID=UPI000BBA68D4|nr:penicillin-binding transpeptidase domain-containing protein [Alteribacter populi]
MSVKALVHRSFLYIGFLLVLDGCSGDEQNPEVTLEGYVSAWEEQGYGEMSEFLDLSSQSEYGGSFTERFAEVHEKMEVSSIQVNYEPRDFEEEEIDWDEVNELTYPVGVEMETVAGSLNYDTEIQLVMEVVEEDGDEVEVWSVVFDPSHLFMGFNEFDDQVVMETVDPESRGQIFDRNGESLAVNGAFYQIGFQYGNIEDLKGEAEELADLLGLDAETVEEQAVVYEENPDWMAPVMSVPMADERVDEVRAANIPGVVVQTTEGREYPYQGLTGHLTGYIQEVSAEDLEREEWSGYRAGTYIGQRGLELAYEEQLRGEVGFEIRVEDSAGSTREVLVRTDPEDGEDLHLTLDVNVQQELFDAIGDEAGSGVVMDPETGEVLALVSRPVFDPNQVYLGTSSPERTEWVEDERDVNPIRFNGIYSPGSVFKPITAAIGIEEGTLDPNEVVNIDGEQWQASSDWGGYRVTRVNPNVSEVDLETAMTYSDNIYFAQQALAIGEEPLTSWAEEFGIGEEFPFEYPLNESRLANEGLTSDILLADTGYGQGELQMSPVHLTALYTMFVNEGSIMQPTLLEGSDTEVWNESVIAEETASIVLDTMKAVVEDSNGTAHRSNPGHNRTLAGKTGTAEIKDSQAEDVEGDRIGWYTSIDVEEQDYLVTMMIEGRGSGDVVDMANEFWSRVGE